MSKCAVEKYCPSLCDCMGQCERCDSREFREIVTAFSEGKIITDEYFESVFKKYN